TNVIGYVAAMPNSEVNRGINAFTLGVRRVNPTAKVVVMWTGAWQNEEKEAINAERLIREKNADVITYHQDEDSACRIAEKAGVDFIGYNALLTGYSPHCLTSVLCQWDVYYTDIVQRYLKGEINSVKNHWIGIDQNVVKLSEFSSAVSSETAQRVESLKQELLNGKFIFAGELYDNQGVLRCAEDEVIGDDVLLERVDWLIEGVEVFE
ncbi:MAG: BMP family ABC transporter substrate-binding protein, partial [Selenomonadaceae bacterium]|nr:BMP family ABC transporter substrate-binding protein [Selenomonadaceae bacterium]